MTLDDLLADLDAGRTITGDSPLHAVMHEVSQQALRITAELNGSYHEPARVQERAVQAFSGGRPQPAHA